MRQRSFPGLLSLNHMRAATGGGKVADTNHKGLDSKTFRIKRDILIDDEVFYSEAFNSLSASAMRTFMRCLQKRSWKKERVNGKKQIVYTNPDFIFPYAEAAFLGIGTTQHWKNMKHLIEVGFIDLVYQGGWYQRHEREKDYSRYRLSDRWKKYGTPQFEHKEKEKVLLKDYYIRENMKRQKSKPTSQKRRGHLHKSEVDGTEAANNRLHESEVDGNQEKRRKGLVSAV